MQFDLHVHTSYSSCSRLEVEDLLNRAAEIGLDGVCITDHHSMKVKERLTEGLQKNGVFIIIGYEHSTAQGDYLVYGLDHVLPESLTDRELLQQVEQANGIAVAAHPFRNGRSISENVFENRLCHFAEVINGRNTDNENRMAIQKLVKYHPIMCGGSDAHTAEELGAITTRFHVPIESTSDFFLALKEGVCTPQINRHAN